VFYTFDCPIMRKKKIKIILPTPKNWLRPVEVRLKLLIQRTLKLILKTSYWLEIQRQRPNILILWIKNVLLNSSWLVMQLHFRFAPKVTQEVTPRDGPHSKNVIVVSSLFNISTPNIKWIFSRCNFGMFFFRFHTVFISTIILPFYQH